MKDLRWLAILVLMALLVACDVTRASAPLVVNLPQSTQAPQTVVQPHDPPAEPLARPRTAVPYEIVDHFDALSRMHPKVARPQMIIARRGVAWTISYERQRIWVNLDKPVSEIKAAITREFAKRAWIIFKRENPGAARRLKTLKVFTAWLAGGVR